MKGVLVVDDDPGSREVIALMLTIEGYAVATAGSVAEAISAAARSRPAVLVCDLDLGPGGDGCAVARALRASPDLPPIRLIALSGMDTTAGRARAREAGFEAYLLKPVLAPVLLALLADAREE